MKPGLHVIPIALEGRTDELIEHARRMDGVCHKFLDPLADKTLFGRLYDATPRSEWVLRNHARSEDKGAIVTNPAAVGRRHAEEWKAELATLGVGAGRVLVEGINEWIPNSGPNADAIARYSISFLSRCTELGLRAIAPLFSVGWPSHDATGRSDWRPYMELLRYIATNPQHGLGLHEYWPGSGPADGWGYLAGRVKDCPVKGLPLYITECGTDNVIDNGKRGWRDWGLTAEQIAAQCLDYASAVGALDYIVKGIHPFTTGGASEWQSFYMQGEPNRLLGAAAQAAPVPPPVPPPPPTGGTVPPIHPDVQDPRPQFADVFYRVRPAANKAGGYYRVKSLTVEESGLVIVIGHVTGGPTPVWHFCWPEGNVRAENGAACEMGPGAKFTTPDGGPHWAYAGDDPAKSESVHNIGLPAGHHTVFRITWEYVTEASPPSPPPAPVPTPPPPAPGPGAVRWSKVEWAIQEAARILERDGEKESAAWLLASDSYTVAVARRKGIIV